MMSDYKTMSREEFNAEWPEWIPDWWKAESVESTGIWSRDCPLYLADRAHALQEWEKQQPQPLTGGDIDYSLKGRVEAWNESDCKCNVCSSDFPGVCEAAPLCDVHGGTELGCECASKRRPQAQAAVEAHKAAQADQEAPEPKAGFWVTQSSGWRHGEYTLAAFDMVVRLRSNVIGTATTKEEAQRLVEQDMERRAATEGFAEAADECSKPMGILEEIISPAKAARPWEKSEFLEVRDTKNFLWAMFSADSMAAFLNHLADRQDAQFKAFDGLVRENSLIRMELSEAKNRQDAYAARIEALEKRDAFSLDAFRLLEKEVKALAESALGREKRLLRMERRHSQVAQMASEGERESSDHEGRLETLEAKDPGSALDEYLGRIEALEKRVGELTNQQTQPLAKDPELPRNPRGLEKVVEVLRERGRHYKPEGGPWTPEQFSAFGAMMEAASIVEKALAQPQPASEPCGVDWEELAESLKQWIWKEHGHANSNFKALDLVAIVKAHLANCGEVE